MLRLLLLLLLAVPANAALPAYKRHRTHGSPCGRFPTDAANRLGACVTHHTIRITDERRLFVRLVAVPGTESNSGDFAAGPHPTEELLLTQRSACIDQDPPCRVLMQGTNVRVATSRTPDSVYIGLAPDSDVWDTWARVEVSVRNLRATVVQLGCRDACATVVSNMADPEKITWQPRTPALDATVIELHDAFVVTATHVGLVNPEHEELLDRNVPQSLAWVILITAFSLAMVGVGVEQVYYPWRSTLPHMLLSVLALQVLAWLALLSSDLLTNMDRYFYWVHADAWHTYGWHLVVAVPASWLFAVGLLVWSGWNHVAMVLAHVVHVEMTLVLLTFVTDVRHRPQPFICIFTLAHVWQLYGVWRATAKHRGRRKLPAVLHVLHCLLALWFEATHGQNLMYGLWAQVLDFPESMASVLAWAGLIAVALAELAVLTRQLKWLAHSGPKGL